jgi:hypothetical protein
LRQLGGVFSIGATLIISAMWIFAKNSTIGTKVAVTFAMITVACLVALSASIASSFTVAEVRNGRLNFYFCGMRTRSISVDAPTTFELSKYGRLEVLRIRSGGSSYVPNGCLDYRDVADLLRANGVAERNAV